MTDKIFYHEMPKSCGDHKWSEPPADWDRSQDFTPTCLKCGMSFIAYTFMEMP